MSLLARLEARRAAVREAGLTRRLRRLEMQGPVEGLLDGRPVLVHCSNDSLGLAHHPEVVAAWQGAGTGSARLISGNRPAHEALEAALSARFGRPATLLSSGWHANLAALTTLFEAGDVVSSDALNHASLIDGLRLSKAGRRILPHGESALPEGVVGHVTEGLFSMDGDRVDLPALRRACDERGAWLVVDEAHAVGAVGPEGRGAAADAGVEPDVLVGTLGKAFGSYGAFVVGPPVLRDLLVSRGRTFLFTTGLPEPVCRAALAGLRLGTDARRARLRRNSALLRERLRAHGLDAPGSDHIVPIVLGPSTMAVADALLRAGHYVVGIRPPTVAPRTERLRISLTAAHTTEHIESLVEALVAAVGAQGAALAPERHMPPKQR